MQQTKAAYRVFCLKFFFNFNTFVRNTLLDNINNFASLQVIKLYSLSFFL